MKPVNLQSTLNLTTTAIERLLAQKNVLNLPNLAIQSLPEFLDAAIKSPLTPAQRDVICEQAILILDQFYAHLQFKRARYGVDPVQRLRLLRARHSLFPGDLRFHSEIIQVFTELRDAHTLYGLPAPFRGALAFLPFVLKSYTGNHGLQRFVVTQVLRGFDHPDFRPGAEVLYWNGMPMPRAVEQLALDIPAGNEASKFVRGLARLTSRSLTYALPPPEEYVMVQYASPAGENVLFFPWSVATGFPEGAFRAPATAICQPVADRAAIRDALWGHQTWTEQENLQERQRLAASERQHLGQAPIFESVEAIPSSLREPDLDFLYTQLPDIFEFQHPSGLILERSITPDELCESMQLDSKRFGYIRIKSFEAPADSIFNEFKRILGILNEFGPDGLVLDVRGNPGGSINGAERLLQLLTPHEITPALFHFANTPTIQQILAEVSVLRSDDFATSLKIRKLQSEFGPWMEDAASALAEGLAITEGRPLTSRKTANDTGQIYHGPVVLLIDAVSYSATDLFSAGFQDHEIGDIIGVDTNTGGGGASRWWHHDDLLERLDVLPDLPLKPLPNGATIAFASLRSSRVRRRAGQALEDVGVLRSVPYQLTKVDIMDWGSDLVRFACGELARKPVYLLEVTSAVFRAGEIIVTVRARNLVRLVCHVNGIPQFSGDASRSRLHIPLDGLAAGDVRELEVRGYASTKSADDEADALELAAATRYRDPILYSEDQPEAGYAG